MYISILLIGKLLDTPKYFACFLDCNLHSRRTFKRNLRVYKMADVQANNNAGTGGQVPNTARLAAPANPLITVQDRLFHTLFFRITQAYARGCPKPLRRIIEMMILVKVMEQQS